jgi:signal transduction histidine kinase
MIGCMLETSISDDSIRERFKVMRTLILNTLQKAENIATELRPAVLDVFGLTKAMEWHMNDFKARTGINYCFQDISETSLPDKERSTALFRIFQEAIANIGRHAQASQIHITLNSAQESIALVIKDNGKGISIQQVHDIKSLGILGMQERARMMGGSCEIRRNDEGGTCVTITLPNSKNDP